MEEVLPGVQHLYDRPHLSRNVVFNFPELRTLGVDLKKLLDNVFYARTYQDLETSLSALMTAWD